jgi:hypothetical protein
MKGVYSIADEFNIILYVIETATFNSVNKIS